MDSRRSAQHQCALLDCTRSSDAHQSLPRTTRQDNDPRSRSSVSKHLGERRLLIGPNDRHGFQLDIEIGIGAIVPKVVFLQCRQIDILTPPTHFLHLLCGYFERVYCVFLVHLVACR